MDEYKAKLHTCDEAVKVIKSGDSVHYGAFLGVIHELDKALAKRVDDLKDVKIYTTIWPYSHYPEIVQADPETTHFKFHTTQFGALERKMNKEGKCWYVPVQFREQVKYFQQDIHIDVAMLQVAPMDKYGNFNIGPQVADSRAIMEKASIVIVEVNEKMPRVHGIRNTVNISEIDYIVHGNNIDLPVSKEKSASPIDEAIAKFIVPRIKNGSSLQLGIGGLPNCVGSMIAQSDITDLSVHSEMFVDAFYNLYQAGKISSSKKLDPGKMTWTFSMGSKELYEFIDDNPLHHCCPVDYVNEIQTIAQLDNFVSINSCLEVDLFSQVNSESIGWQHIGGNGGQLDFVLGAYLSRGGQSFLCTPSTHVNKDGTITSQIKPRLTEGSIVTVPRQVVQYIVTEYGVAALKGKSTWERAEAMIGIAHPDFRDDLIREAERMGIWKYSSKVLS